MIKRFSFCRNMLLPAAATAILSLSLSAQDAEPVKPEAKAKAKTEEKTAVDPILLPPAPNFELSTARKKEIHALIQKYVDSGKELDLPGTFDALCAEIAEKMPLEPAQKPANINSRDLGASVSQQVKAKFDAEYDAKIKDLAVREAEKKFPLTPLRQKVTVSYQQGPFSYTVEGILYKITAVSIQVNDKTVPFVDMDTATRTRYDERFNRTQRDEYVENVQKRYRRKQNQFSRELYEKSLADQLAANEKTGWIFEAEPEPATWISAKAFAAREYEPEKVVYTEKKAQLAREKAEQIAKEALEKTKNNGSLPVQIQTGNEAEYQKVVEAVGARFKKIREKHVGIDANQGFLTAPWGATRYEIAYLFSRTKGLKLESKIMSDTIVFSDGFPNPVSVDLDYAGGALDKVTENYDKLSFDQFETLKKNIKNRFGLAVEEKAAKDRDLFTEIDEGKLKPEAMRKKDAKPANPDAFEFHWVGENTVGRFTFQYDFNEGAYSNVVFVKEMKKADAAEKAPAAEDKK